ncbi:MAG TPA: hypothetical protein PLC03_14095, partial [Microthrixaceae bacterium]|nr:hypothetical protein [Microthrixaceae bacterium]
MESKGTHTHERSRRARSVRRGVAAVGVATAGLLAWTLPSQAQDPEPAPTTNFHMAGIADPAAGTMLAVDKQISGEFQYCSNANGLGAELYLNAGDGAGMAVEQATVTPFVVPIHIGVVSINNPDPENTITGERFLTLGVVKGTPIEFGQSGPATVEYGGVFIGPKAGLINWTYSATASCTVSRAMPIISDLMDLGTLPAPATTTTTEAPTTTDA